MGVVRLGFLGAGLAVRQLHWPAIERLPGRFRVELVCDADPAAAAATAALTGCRRVTGDYRELLADPAVDAVVIALPIHLNAAMLRAAAAAGKHALCEKPIAADLPEAELLADELRGAPTVIAVAENFHYRDDLRQARRWMDAGLLGEIVSISLAGQLWANTSEGFSSTPWRHAGGYRGALVADSCVHHAAALRELGGEIDAVQAFVRSIRPELGGPDTLALNAWFRSGVLGQIAFSGAARPAKQLFDRIDVLGTEGQITGFHGHVRLARPEAEPLRFESADLFGYREEFRNFHAAITAGEPVVATLDEALADWRVVMRALDSAETGAVVALGPPQARD